jgi:hypothetical protein
MMSLSEPLTWMVFFFCVVFRRLLASLKAANIASSAPGGNGQVYCRKVAKNFGHSVFSQHAKLNMAGFVLYFLGGFSLRYKMAGVHPRAASNQYSAVSETKTKSFLPQRTQRPRRKETGLPRMNADERGTEAVPMPEGTVTASRSMIELERKVGGGGDYKR